MPKSKPLTMIDDQVYATPILLRSPSDEQANRWTATPLLLILATSMTVLKHGCLLLTALLTRWQPDTRLTRLECRYSFHTTTVTNWRPYTRSRAEHGQSFATSECVVLLIVEDGTAYSCSFARCPTTSTATDALHMEGMVELLVISAWIRDMYTVTLVQGRT